MVEWNKETPLSKALSIIFFFVLLPLLILYVGLKYKQVVNTYSESKQTLESSVQNLSKQVQESSTTKPNAVPLKKGVE